MKHILHVFLIALLVSLLGQTVLWQTDRFTDEELWVNRVAQLKSDFANGRLDAWNEIYSGQPAMSVVSVAALAHTLGSPIPIALRGTVSLFVALASAGVVSLAYWLKPSYAWWFAAGALMVFHPLYPYATPTNAVVAALVPLIVLGTFWLASRSRLDRFSWAHVAVGSAVGLAAVTRGPEALIVCLFMAAWLIARSGIRPVLYVFGVGAVTAFVFDPFLWFDGINHISYVLFRSSLNFTTVATNPLQLSDFLTFAPLTLMSIVLATVFLLQKRVSSSLPRSFIGMLLVMTVVYGFAFLQIKAQSLRHFIPLFLTWEILLPLFLLDMLKQSTFSFADSPVMWRSWLTATCVGLLALGPMILVVLSVS